MVHGTITNLGNDKLIPPGQCFEPINVHTGQPTGKFYRRCKQNDPEGKPVNLDPVKTSRYVELPNGEVQYLPQKMIVRIASEEEFLEYGCLEAFPA